MNFYFGILIDHIIILDLIFHRSLAEPGNERPVLLREELVLFQHLADRHMAWNLLLFDLKQDVQCQFSCIYHISHHFLSSRTKSKAAAAEAENRPPPPRKS